jgi:hypothetical protein
MSSILMIARNDSLLFQPGNVTPGNTLTFVAHSNIFSLYSGRQLLTTFSISLGLSKGRTANRAIRHLLGVASS